MSEVMNGSGDQGPFKEVGLNPDGSPQTPVSQEAEYWREYLGMVPLLELVAEIQRRFRCGNMEVGIPEARQEVNDGRMYWWRWGDPRWLVGVSRILGDYTESIIERLPGLGGPEPSPEEED